MENNNDKEIKKLFEELKHYFEVGNYNKIIEICDKIIELDHKSEKAYSNKGIALQELGKYEEAIECYDKIIELNPKSEIGYRIKGYALLQLGKYEEAIECYDKIIELNPKSEEAYGDKGYALRQLEKYEEAIICYDKAIELNPKSEEAYGDKGYALRQLGKYEEAIIYYDKAIELNPKNEVEYGIKGDTLQQLRKYEEAIECYDNAIELNPKDENAYGAKGNALLQLGKYEESIECYDKIIELNPKSELAYRNKGNALLQLGKYEESIEYSDKAIELNPKNELAYIYKGIALLQLGKCEEAIKLNPKSEIGYEIKGVALLQLGKYEEAIECYDKIIELNPKSEEAYGAKVDALQQLGKYEEAIECYNKIIELNPKNEDAYISKYIILIIFERYKEASELLQTEEIKNNKLIDIYYIINNFMNCEEDYNIAKTIENISSIDFLWSEEKETYFISTVGENKNESFKKLWILQYILLYLISLKDKDELNNIAHYTSIEAFKKMAFTKTEENKEYEPTELNKMRMASVSNANDPKEGEVISRLLEKNDIVVNYASKKDNFVAVQTSFSRCIDSLTMMRLYGKNEGEEGTGCSLVFSKDFFDTYISNKNMPLSSFSLELEKRLDKKDLKIDIELKKEIKNLLPIYYVLYYNEEENELIFNPCKSDYENIIIKLDNDSFKKYKWNKYKCENCKTEKPVCEHNEKISLCEHIDCQYENLKNNIGYIIKEIFNTIRNIQSKENKEIAYKLLKNIQYLIKDSAFVEEQEMRIIELVQYGDEKLKHDEERGRLYKEYLNIFENRALQKVILGPKVKGSHSLAELYKDKLKKYEESNYGIDVTVSKAPLA